MMVRCGMTVKMGMLEVKCEEDEGADCDSDTDW